MIWSWEVALFRCHCGLAQTKAPPKAHQQCGGYLLLCTYLDEVGSCLETPPRPALAGSGLCEGKQVRTGGGETTISSFACSHRDRMATNAPS